MSKQKAYSLLELREHSLQVDTDELYSKESEENLKVDLLTETEATIAEHLRPLWLLKGVKRDAIYNLHGQGYGVGEPSESKRMDSVVTLGPAFAIMVKNATVMPTRNHIQVGDSYLASEMFGIDKLERETFLTKYGGYNRYNLSSKKIEIRSNDEDFNSHFMTPHAFGESEYTPILFSNHIHDTVFAHWHAYGLYKAYLLEKLHYLPLNPIFLFSYQPKPWQVEMLSFFFPSLRGTVGILDRPTTFKKLLLVCYRNSVFFDGHFLKTIYERGRRLNVKLESRKIFITRGENTWRKIVNSRQIQSLLLSFGYQTVRLSDYLYPEQVRLIQSSYKIIFITGSDFMSSLHASKDCRLACITYRDNDDASIKFCANFGHFSVPSFEAEIYGPRFGEFDLYVDPFEFNKFITSFCLD